MELITYNRPRPAVLLDVDGVLLPCAELGVERWNEEHPEEPPMHIEEITGYGRIGTRVDDLLAYYAEEDFYKKQQPYPGAKAFVETLNTLYDVYFLTAVPDNVVKLRATQLRRFFPSVPKDHVFFGSVKERFMADFSLDDCPDHILSQYDSGAVKHPVIMRRPWNESLSGIMSVNHYDDFLTFIRLVQEMQNPSIPEAVEKGPKVIALVGPAGSDKGALCSELLACGMDRLPSYTTAEPRADEPAGYTHVSVEEFRRRLNDGEFVESTAYGHHYYGISKNGVEEVLQGKNHAVTVVDICGAVTLKRLFGQRCLMVYVKRSQDALLEDMINKHEGGELRVRLQSLAAERKNRELCDITLRNNHVKEAAEALCAFLQ